MERIAIRIPSELARALEQQALEMNLTKSEVARRRLISGSVSGLLKSEGFEMIADLVGAVEGLPSDLSSKKTDYLNRTGYGKSWVTPHQSP